MRHWGLRRYRYSSSITSLCCFKSEAGIAADELAVAAKRDAARLVADFRAHLQADAHALAFIPHGSPGLEIVKAAKEWQADLIVIGSHGRRGITRALVGSVAEAVMRHAPCPVVVVGPRG